MSEEKNDKPATTPPPLVPPPVRSPDAAESTTADQATPEDSVDAEPDFVEPVAEPTPEERVDEPVVVEERIDTAPDTAVVEPAVVDEETAEPVATAAPVFVPAAEAAQPQRIFVAAPIEPKKKGNRGFGALIALLSVILFALLYAIVAVIIIAVEAPGQPLLETLTEFAINPVFFVPAIFYVIGFVIVVLLANRANWGAYVLGSLFVAAFVYFGTIGVQLVSDNAFGMTPTEASDRFAQYASNPFVIAAALSAREVSIWIGSAISARGRRLKARNVAAHQEFERASAEHRAEYQNGYAPTS